MALRSSLGSGSTPVSIVWNYSSNIQGQEAEPIPAAMGQGGNNNLSDIKTYN